jgi:SulP family sulfate permease
MIGMSRRYQFNRMEIAGSMGDLGTLLPLAIGLIFVTGLPPSGLFLSVGLYYILSGLYFGVTVPVQPMKIIGAYAIATAMSANQVLASGVMMGLLLLIIGVTGAVTLIGKYIPKSVVRGVQLSTGILLMVGGVRFMIGTSKFQMLQQMAEPYLTIQSLGPIPIGILFGLIGCVLVFMLIENRKFPAALILVFGGIAVGLLFGTHEGVDQLRIGFSLPQILPLGLPSGVDFAFAFFALVLPQIPMTLGNAVVAYVDLSKEYFPDNSRKVTYKSACISMAVANFLSFILGGMPLCHGAGGLAAHYRFGARTGGSNLIIGVIFVLLAIFLGSHVLMVVKLLPMSILGVLLLFAGGQLALTLVDTNGRKDLFVALIMLGITLASNLAAGFIVGIAIAYALKWDRLNI